MALSLNTCLLKSIKVGEVCIRTHIQYIDVKCIEPG